MSTNTPTPTPHPPLIGRQAHTSRRGKEGRALIHTHHKPDWQTKSEHPNKSLWTYKAVEHGAGHPSCEAHVEERQGCAWMTHSLQSSSTTRARGAGITILLPAGASPPLVHSEPLCPPPHSPPPLFARSPFSRGAVGQQARPGSHSEPTPPPPPLPEWGERARWCLKTAPVALLRKGG